MKQLFEYLISKDNKKNVKSGLKYSLRSGDIVQFWDSDCLLYISEKDIKNDEWIYDYIGTEENISEGMFIRGYGHSLLMRNPIHYNNDLTAKKKNLTADAAYIYRGDGKFPKYTGSFDIGLDAILKMMKQRKAEKIW